MAQTKEEVAAYRKRWYQENKKHHNAKRLEARHRLKKEVTDHYGGKCYCCGETELDFLCIDHIDGGGNKHKKQEKISSGTGFHEWLRKNNFPEGFQTACHNCNFSKHKNKGLCAHKIRFRDLVGMEGVEPT